MHSYPKLNFPRINLHATEQDGRTLVFDRIRSTYVVLTPEEWVRQHLVEFLVLSCKAPLRSIVEEYAVCLNSMPQRADVVVLGGDTQPLLLAECKSPEVNFDNTATLNEVFLQATRYNAVLGAKYIILTNGLRHFCYELTPQGYTSLNHFPPLG